LISAAAAVPPSFGVNFDNSFFSAATAADFPSAFGVPGSDWFGTRSAVSGDHLGSNASGVVSYSAPSMNGGSINLKWTSDRFWGDQPSPVYGYTHANVDPNDPTGQTGLANAGVPLSGEEAVLKGSLVGSFSTATGLGQKIQINITGLDSIATAAGVPLKYQVKVIASEFGLPRSFYIVPYNFINPAPGFAVRNFYPATVTDNAAHSETIAFSDQWGTTPTWNPPPIDGQGPFYSSAATGDSTTVFTGSALTITLDGQFDFGGAWGNSNYGVTRLAGFTVTFVNPGQAGDFDGDGDVDGADFIVWQTNYPTTSGAGLDDGDADSDGDVDGADFAAWQSNFPVGPGPGSSPVPEPSAALLMAISLIGAAHWRLKTR
jgi:hypothetical protein